MHSRNLHRALVLSCALALWGMPRDLSAQRIIPLGSDDRAYVDRYLGADVVGKAVEARPIGEVRELLALEQKAVLRAKIVHGEDRGETRRVGIERLRRGGGTPAWRISVGSEQVMYGQLSPGGDFEIHSVEKREQGVVTRYSPPEPVVVHGIEPGETRRLRIDVKVYDLARPDELTHSGHLDLTYEYVGAYEVTVPLGTFETVLFRWHYRGTVGPADIEDRQYYFIAPGVGVVAMVEQRDVSALFVYSEHSKVAAVLTERTEKPERQ